MSPHARCELAERGDFTQCSFCLPKGFQPAVSGHRVDGFFDGFFGENFFGAFAGPLVYFLLDGGVGDGLVGGLQSSGGHEDSGPAFEAVVAEFGEVRNGFLNFRPRIVG